MNLSLSQLPVKNPVNKTIKQIQVPIFVLWDITNERSGIPHDAIRLNDKPLIYTEECVAAGSREDLL